MEKEFDKKKTKYFIIAILLLIFLGVVLIIHFNNKSLVKGEKGKTTTTTTTTVTTTTKRRTTKRRVIKEEYVSKSSIDNNNLVYNYTTSKEILETDKLISTKLELNEYLISNNVISLYDISLYDDKDVKKNVINTAITIKLPVENIEDYNNLKIVYINDDNLITDEVIESKIENNYVVFTTTHLSKFGITGEKKINLDNVTLDIMLNDKKIEDLTYILATKEDTMDVKVNNIEHEYELYYALKNNEEVKYELFDKNLLNKVETPNKYTLLIKVVVKDVEKIFEVGTLDIYDIVFTYDKTEEVKEDVVIGTLYNEDKTEYKNEDGSEYKYDNFELNNNIVIDNVEEVIEENATAESDSKLETDSTEEKTEVSTQESITESNDELTETDSTLESENDSTVGTDTNDTIIEDTDTSDNNEEPEEEINLEDKATITLNGNVYLVEKTDISNLEINGYLIIDTTEDIVFKKDEATSKLNMSNIYSIIIRSKEFTLNGIKYTYEITDGNVIIKKYEEVIKDEVKEEVETDVTDSFKDIFDNVEVDTNENDELVISKKEETEIIEQPKEEIVVEQVEEIVEK